MNPPPSAAAGRALLLAAVLVAVARMAVAQRVNVTYAGKYYEMYTQLEAAGPNLLDNFFWGNSSAASAACNLVNSSLGAPNLGSGPCFAYNASSSQALFFFRRASDGACISGAAGITFSVTWAFSTLLPSPSPQASPSPLPQASPSPSAEASPSPSAEASPSPSPKASPSPSPDASPSPSAEASPSPSPEASSSPSPEASPSPSPLPLDCNTAKFNLPILSSRLNSQICASNKAVRQGKQSKYVTNVALSLMDASNQPATVNITDIVTNKATAGWQCKCQPTKRDNCTCLPNAVLLGGGSFLVMPQWRRSTRTGNIVDTTLQVSFTGTAGNGATCNGTAVICSAWGVRPNQPRPTCTPFNSTGVTRPALTCI